MVIPMPVIPQVAQQIAEAKRLALVLVSEIESLNRGESSSYHIEMADNMLHRIAGKLVDIRTNQQLIQNKKLDPEAGDSWIYTRPTERNT